MLILIKRMLGILLLMLALPIICSLIVGVYTLLSYNNLNGFSSGFGIGMYIIIVIGLIWGLFAVIKYLLD